MLVKITFVEETFPVSVEKPSFAELRPRRYNAAFSFLTSLTGHGLLVWLLASIVHQVAVRRAMIPEYPLRALAISDTPISWRPANPAKSDGTSSHPAAKSQDGVTAKEQAAINSAPSPESGAVQQPEPEAVHLERRFQLPPVAVHKARQIIIQQDLPADLKLKSATAVPELFLWHQPTPPKPTPDVILVAHREEEPAQRRETSPAAPQLTPRNKEKELADIRHAAAPVMPAPPLSLPIANTTPVRLLDSVVGTRLPDATGPVVPAPEPLNVISVPDAPLPHTPIVVLPPGNQGMPPASSPAGGGAGGKSSAGAGQGSGAGRDPGSKPVQASGSGTAANAKLGQPGGAGSVPAGRVDGRDGGNGSLLPGSSSGLPQPGAAGSSIGSGPPPAGATRIEKPRDGKYSVVVLGSSSAYPEAEGILSGKPVYTVYIRAGARKEWILQYCLPKGAEPAVKVRGSAVPIDAPYPFVIYHPDLPFLNDLDYLIVHGFINAAGKFEHLAPLGDIDSGSKELLIGALDHWEFRPASRDGEPSTVEIALIIPRDRI